MVDLKDQFSAFVGQTIKVIEPFGRSQNTPVLDTPNLVVSAMSKMAVTDNRTLSIIFPGQTPVKSDARRVLVHVEKTEAGNYTVQSCEFN